MNQLFSSGAMIFSPRLSVSLLLALLVSLSSQLGIRDAFAQETLFPLFPALKGSVEFWKLVFTHYSTSEVIFFDPLDPAKIYKVLEVGKNNRARRLIRRERRRILSEQGVMADKARVRVQRGAKERFASGLALSRRYLDQMQQIFREEGLPIELTYLPLIESSFNIRARSRAGALGIWQFIRSTGRRFLRVSRRVDERRDPLESTRAAAQLLKENYDVFGNWPLAITAYNHGRQGIVRAVAELGPVDLMEIIQHYESRTFGFASKNFYAEFLAALEVAEKGEEYFPNLEYHPPFPLEEVEMERTISIAAVLRRTDISRSEFLEWNPALSPRIRYIPRGYRVKVPPGKLELFRVAYQQTPERRFHRRSSRSACRRAASWTCYRVGVGETLSHIAKRYGTSVRKIQKLNELVSPHFIDAGQYLKIPNH
ncbi:MAG: transglycosylase SLT domain-containing protein [Deltaproteobacteria bacterium]|nr:transglycosylase SLT domain-containing protein [Deltaproteobacteria bacterium]